MDDIFKAFENEVANHQPRIDDILGTGQELIDSGHFACDQIEEWCDRLSESWESLLEKCNERREMLGDAAESQRVRKSKNCSRNSNSCNLIGCGSRRCFAISDNGYEMPKSCYTEFVLFLNGKREDGRLYFR